MHGVGGSGLGLLFTDLVTQVVAVGSVCVGGGLETGGVGLCGWTQQQPSRFVGRCQKEACKDRWQKAEAEVKLLRRELDHINSSLDEQAKGRLRPMEAELQRMRDQLMWEARETRLSVKSYVSRIGKLAKGIHNYEVEAGKAADTIAELSADLVAARVAIAHDVAKVPTPRHPIPSPSHPTPLHPPR